MSCSRTECIIIICTLLLCVFLTRTVLQLTLIKLMFQNENNHLNIIHEHITLRCSFMKTAQVLRYRSGKERLIISFMN